MTARAAYIAGIIDADGHISWRPGKHNTVSVGVTNTSEALIEWLVSNVGGNFGVQRPAGDNGGLIKQRMAVRRWRIEHESAAILLRSIRPYLIIKGDRADAVLLQWEEHIKTMARPWERLAIMERCREHMTTLGWD